MDDNNVITANIHITGDVVWNSSAVKEGRCVEEPPAES